LIPDLPDSEFAPWQLARLPEDVVTLLMAVQGEASDFLCATSPSPTITSNHGAGKYRAFVNGRVVKMTPRALARFQSFPDWYELPDSASLAAKGIGNAVPPLFAERLYTIHL